MLEEDYSALEENQNSTKHGLGNAKKEELTEITDISTEVIREVIIPAIEKEVNEGKTFANLRQIYNASILATWYKQNLQKSLLGQKYVDQNKVTGVDIADKDAKFKIYDQYVAAFKKGVYNFIKEDYDSATQKIIPRKYFSGGAVVGINEKDIAMTSSDDIAKTLEASLISSPIQIVTCRGVDEAMVSSRISQKNKRNQEKQSIYPKDKAHGFSLENSKIGITGFTGSLGLPFTQRLLSGRNNFIQGITRSLESPKARQIVEAGKFQTNIIEAPTFFSYASSGKLKNYSNAVSFAKNFLEQHPFPSVSAAYDLSKLISERIVYNYENGIILRAWHVYGAGDETNRRIPNLIRELKDPTRENEPLKVVREKIAFVYIDEILDAFEIAATVPIDKNNKVINIAGDNLIDTIEIAQKLKRLLDSKREIREIEGTPIRPLEFSNNLKKKLGVVSRVPFNSKFRWYYAEFLLRTSIIMCAQ